MTELNEHVAYLSQEIGPRPAGTEEEQRAALYISDALSNEAGLPTTLEDFQCNPDSGLVRALCYGVAVVVTLIATIVAALAIPALVIGFICAALVAAEIFGKPVLSRLMNKGVSQNVVAQYKPMRSTTRSSRRRKVIVVANYDSGKVRRGLTSSVVAALPVIQWAELAGLVLMPVLLLIRFIVAPSDVALIVFNVLLAVAMVLAVLPVVSFVMEKLADYNEAANCNAAGVAVMMEVARRVAEAQNLPDEPDALIHGEQAAQSAGLVPEGAELVYETAPSADADVDTSMESAAARLAAAKAAVAALSGKPVSSTTNVVESNPSEQTSDEPAQEAAEASDEEKTAPASVVAPIAIAPAVEEPASDVPEWFKKGQEQAKRPAVEKPVQRSRYADALAAAEEEIQSREEADQAAAELDARMRTMRASVQAAAEAAGSHKTAVIDPAPAADQALEAQQEVPAAPAPATSDAPVSASAATSETPSPSPAPEKNSTAARIDNPTIAVPAIEPSSTPKAPAVSSSLPTIEVADEAEVMVREAPRPLTGSTENAALAGIPNPADSIPAPAPKSGRRLVVPAIGEEVVAEEAAAPAQRRRRAISLPNIGVSQELPRISMDDRGQAAPLSEERPARDGRVRDLSAVIPAVAEPSTSGAVSSRTGANEAALRNVLPSLNTPASQNDPSLSGSISLAGSFASIGATGAAPALGEELFENASPDDLYIDDADDSAYQEQITETGAMAGPGYVEMPKSRFGRLFGKLRRKEKEQVSTPQEWLDVEDTFEAQEVGAARGSWESFRDDSVEDLGQTTAFTPDYLEDAFDDEYDANMGSQPRYHGRPFEGGAFTPEEGEADLGETMAVPVSAFAEGLPADFVFEAQPEETVIEQFHAKRVDMEVWFVALGSELANNGGMRAFMDAHAADLKGSIIIELQGLGAGQLTLIDKEGTYGAKKASSRMKRLVKKAGQAVGLSVPTGTMEWMNSAAGYALKHGQQSMHLAGMDGRKPAFFAQADDVIENIDEDQLSLNADFVMELLQSI